MQVTGEYKRLCNLLIASFEKKFAYELKSPVYAVAALMNVSNAMHWRKRADFQDLIVRATNAFEEVYTIFERNREMANCESSLDGIEKTQAVLSEEDTLSAIFAGDNYESQPSNLATQIISK